MNHTVIPIAVQSASKERKRQTPKGRRVDPSALAEVQALLGVESRQADLLTLYARADDSSPRGSIFVPFCYYEAAINKLTNAALDPIAKIPEFKYCAIRISLGGTPPVQASYGGGQALEKIAMQSMV